ncbi:type ISP restriction/modification enzyme [Lutibacter sp.]|uniref:type ISP restriction/modification enzyme n=1 Tax=Lutibacter sp. TaxID=1925666 RepID=UPI0025C6A9F1|nr:type ISP restriction/modification enzyme [Lutibacter sp.]MCF6182957.1 DNA methyltransferase [Lutibacter sp.]
MTIEKYIENINQRYQLGNATEHTFRGDLQQLLESLVKDIQATNEPKRQSCGAPDYILTKKDIPVGFIEAKDIGDNDLEGKKKSGNKEQFDRYKASLNNLIFTDYINFHLYHDGIFITKIAIGEITENGIKPIPENFTTFHDLIKDFCTHVGQTIKSSKKLAKMMAGKARLLSDVIEKALTSDETHNEDSTLKEQMLAFKNILIHDITPKGFADVYAQTIAYGMFAARLHDPTLDTFSRQEAAELIPKSNPFLRKLFGYIAGPDIDDRIKWIVDNLTEIFLACNVEKILKNYGKSTKMENPIIHFYETFLSEYDPKLRKARGVWYTPAPVVNFIVRAVDDILKTEFDLPQGLADTSKIIIDKKVPKFDERSKSKSKIIGEKIVKQEVHKVQILDPATGTGTFLAEVIKHVNKKFKGQEGIWSSYVENNLLPRLNGFELLMASYAMAHLQIDLLLKDTGYDASLRGTKQSLQRTKIYLTNSLEEFHPDTGTLFANWLSSEANEANDIKRDTPVMCIIGNPPYSGESANKGDWIMSLMDDYKKEPGGKEKLKEQNSKFINDDYVKFLRYGQHFIEKNGSGVLAFINPHGFLDNPTFRGMRWNLLKTYDKIYTLDLHGNAKKKEVCPDGSIDQNVFDIMQGVAITIFVKTGKKKKNELGKVFHYDLFGKRDFKYNFLNKNSLKTIKYEELPNKAPNYFMVQKDFKAEKSYNSGFCVTDLFKVNSLGIQTHRDSLSIDSSKIHLEKRITDFYDLTIEDETLKEKYTLKENSEWKLKKQRNDNFEVKKVIKIDYRPFDTQYIYFDKNIVDRLRVNVSKHIVNKENICLIVPRQCVSDWRYIFISKNIIESNLTGTAGRYGSGNFFPLYLYPETNNQQLSIENTKRIPNLNKEIINEIAKKLQLTFVSEKVLDTSAKASTRTNVIARSGNDEAILSKETDCHTSLRSIRKDGNDSTFAPIDILDYIYAVLHSPTYRKKYKEFLKIDFPRVPYPKNTDTFWQLVKLGGEIRQLHLLESPKVEKYITSYPISGDNKITRKLTKTDIGFEPNTVLDTSAKVSTKTDTVTSSDFMESNGIKLYREEIKGKVYINDTQYFDNVPLTAWEFYIGGYQPAQKWLKDRKGRILSFEDILHYQKIIVALSETNRLMKAIDKIEIE